MSETEITTLASMLLISDIENILKKNYVPADEAESKLRHVKDRLDDLRKEMAEQAAEARKEKERLTAFLEQSRQTETNLKTQIDELNKQLEKQAVIIAEDSIKKEQLKNEKISLSKELEQSRQNENNLQLRIDEMGKKVDDQAAIIADNTFEMENEQLKAEKKSADDALRQIKESEAALKTDIERI